MSQEQNNKPGKGTIFGGLGLLGLLALKGKGAMLLFGAKILTLLKMSWLLKSFTSIFVTFGIYGVTLGWPYAAALVVIIMTNTLGQFFWMKSIGLKPKLPVLIPFVGAAGGGIEEKVDQMTRAWIAFSGPLIGAVGSATMYWSGLHLNQIWLQAAGSSGFFFNLIQLIPAKPLSGGFVVEAVSKWLLIPGTMFLVYLAYKFQSILFFIIAVVSALSLVAQFMIKKEDAQTDEGPYARRPYDPNDPHFDESGTASEEQRRGGDPAMPVWEAESKSPTPLQRVTIGLAYLSLVWMLGDLYSMTTISLRELIGK